MPQSPLKSGVLILVVGPSGAGKDALMSAARRAHGDDGGLVFARRVITRPALAGAEDHDTLDAAAFAAAEAGGAFLLSWRAHDLAYGIPAGYRDDLAAGRDVIMNGSRRIVPAAEALGVPIAVLHVTAAPEVLAARISARGRESLDEVAARVGREAPLAATCARVFDIRNDGALAEGEAAFLAALAAARHVSGPDAAARGR